MTLEQDITSLQVFKMMTSVDKEAVLEIIRKHKASLNEKVGKAIAILYIAQEELKSHVGSQVLPSDLGELNKALKEVADESGYGIAFDAEGNKIV